MNRFPLAALFDQYLCALTSDLGDSAIRSGTGSHQVTCDNCGGAVDPHLRWHQKWLSKVKKPAPQGPSIGRLACSESNLSEGDS